MTPAPSFTMGIEEDEDILDPGEFGILGEYQKCDFDDYPEDLMKGVDQIPDSDRKGRHPFSSCRC